ncbi:MAG TPA: hypothetical protein VKS23_06265 [Thermoanaerobaculia bacterium]|nr:hypothetical protein [Thermoanaerobaculia bacterium]
MGSASPPPTVRPPAVRPTPGAEGAPPASASSRYHFADRKVAMGPSGTTILLVIAAVAVGLWLYFKPPGEIGPQALQRYAGFESNMEAVVLRNCSPPGCAAVYLTPTVGTGFKEALPLALQVAGELEQQGSELFIVFGEEPVKEAVARARSVRRPVVFDPNGDWAKESGIEKSPYWIAWRTGGKVRLRSQEPVSAADIMAAIR